MPAVWNVSQVPASLCECGERRIALQHTGADTVGSMAGGGGGGRGGDARKSGVTYVRVADICENNLLTVLYPRLRRLVQFTSHGVICLQAAAPPCFGVNAVALWRQGGCRRERMRGERGNDHRVDRCALTRATNPLICCVCGTGLDIVRGVSDADLGLINDT